MQRIVEADGTVLAEGTGSALFRAFMLHSAQGHKLKWGDHYRVMRRRVDAPDVIVKCKGCGRRLEGTHPNVGAEAARNGILATVELPIKEPT